jgi:hypothetical protein
MLCPTAYLLSALAEVSEVDGHVDGHRAPPRRYAIPATLSALSHTAASSSRAAAFFSSESSPHDDPVSCQQDVHADSPRTSTSTAAALDVHPAGIETSLLNSGDTSPAPNGGGKE